MGALGDSYYEYLLKQWLLSDKKDGNLRQMYVTAVDGMKEQLLGRASPSGMLFVGESSASQPLIPKMEHLTCFVPGMLALGYLHGMPNEHLAIAKELTETCVQVSWIDLFCVVGNLYPDQRVCLWNCRCMNDRPRVSRLRLSASVLLKPREL